MISLPSGPVQAGSEPLPHDVVLLPSQEADGVGFYDASLAGVPRALRASGIDAGYWHDTEHRRSQMGIAGTTLEIVIGFSAAVTGGAAWEALKTVLQKVTGDHKRVKATILRQRRRPDGTLTSQWLEFTGPPESFLTALPQVLDEGNQPVSDHPGQAGHRAARQRRR